MMSDRINRMEATMIRATLGVFMMSLMFQPSAFANLPSALEEAEWMQDPETQAYVHQWLREVEALIQESFKISAKVLGELSSRPLGGSESKPSAAEKRELARLEGLTQKLQGKCKEAEHKIGKEKTQKWLCRDELYGTQVP
jgi:hypothetical protein